MVDAMLTPTLQQLSATLQARLISLTVKEAFSLVNATEGQGIEAWRQLGKRVDPQTDAGFALLLISLVDFTIGKGQDVQSELVRWETMLLSLERDHAEKLSPKIHRALLLNISPTALQPASSNPSIVWSTMARFEIRLSRWFRCNETRTPWTPTWSTARTTRRRRKRRKVTQRKWKPWT